VELAMSPASSADRGADLPAEHRAAELPHHRRERAEPAHPRQHGPHLGGHVGVSWEGSMAIIEPIASTAFAAIGSHSADQTGKVASSIPTWTTPRFS